MNQIEIESLAAITAATEPVGSADIFGNIQSASCIKDISRAIYRLKQQGDIVEISNGKAKRLYRATTEKESDDRPHDDILTAIAAASRPQLIQDSELHAQRLRAIAAWPALDASIAEWLCDLATQLEAQS